MRNKARIVATPAQLSKSLPKFMAAARLVGWSWHVWVPLRQTAAFVKFAGKMTARSARTPRQHYRQAAAYVDRILKIETPADLIVGRAEPVVMTVLSGVSRLTCLIDCDHSLAVGPELNRLGEIDDSMIAIAIGVPGETAAM
jgi:hypothetical protein